MNCLDIVMGNCIGKVMQIDEPELEIKQDLRTVMGIYELN
jgi:hypothetical protein